MVVVESSIQELRRMLAQRDDVPLDFDDFADVQHPRSGYREYRSNYTQGLWETNRDNGSLYPSEESYTPYLEMV